MPVARIFGKNCAPQRHVRPAYWFALLAGIAHSASGQGTSAAYVHVAAGANFSFAIQSNGALWAWGDNAYGEFGDGTTGQRTAPVVVPEPTGASPGSRWVRIMAHDSNLPVFGLRSDNTLWRWGNGQTRPVQVALVASLPSGATLIDLATSSAHFLALYSDGSLWSWGANSLGQLGTGATAAAVVTPTQVVTPATAAAGTYWTAIEAISNESFAVRSDGTLWSWGGLPSATSFSPLGHPVTAAGCFTPELVPPPPTAGPGSGWASVKAGYGHTLGLRTDGTLWAWGRSNYGALGQGVGITGTSVPLQIPVPPGTAAGTRWQAVRAGSDTSQGILSDGTLWAWGSNQRGELGVNSSNSLEATPQQEYNQETWSQSALGLYHAVALSRGRVFVTGNGTDGQLGLGNATTRLYFFVRVVGLPLAAAEYTSGNQGDIFPNPVASGGELTFQGTEPSDQVEWLNSMGQVVAVCRTKTNRPIQLPALGSGMYLLRFYQGKRFLFSRKLQVN